MSTRFAPLFFGLFFLFLLQTHLQAQLSISTMVMPPVPVTAAQIEQAEDELVLFTITNAGDEAIEVQLAFRVENISNGNFSVTTNGPKGDCITIEPGGNVFDLSDLKSSFNGSDLTYTGITEAELIANPELQEGMYEFCIQLFECESGSALTGESEGCAMFTVFVADQPQITSPCLTGWVSRDVDQLQIGWIFTSSPGFMGELEYTVQVAPMQENDLQAAQAVFEQGASTTGGDAPTIIEQTVDGEDGPFLLLDIDEDLDLEDAPFFAVRVIAAAPDGDMLIRNDGKSEVCIFEARDAEALPEEGIQLHYPADGDAIPFTRFPLVSRFYPDDEHRHWNSATNNKRYGRYEHLFTVDAATEATISENNPLLWYSGPQRSQLYLLNQNCNLNLTLNEFPEERSQHIAHNEFDGSSSFKREAGEYDWTADVLIKSYNGSKTFLEGGVEGSFYVGMGPPQLQQPADEAVVPAGPISFSWLSAEAPERLVPDFNVVRTSSGAPCQTYDSQAFERWEIQVSKDEEFTPENRVFSNSSTLGQQTSYASLFDALGRKDDAKVQTLRNELYKSLQSSATVQQPGTYYWRVVWKTNPENDQDTEFYRSSPIRSFIIEDEAGPRDDCFDICEITTPDNQLIPATLTTESKPTIGLFELNITSISGSALDGYDGEGWIEIVWLYDVDVLVTFENIKANDENEIFAGTVEAKKDHNFELELLNNSTVSNALNLANVDKDEINGYLEEPARWLTLYQEGKMALPLSLDREINGERYHLGLMDMTFTPNRARMKVVANVDLPFGGDIGDQILSFGSQLCFGPNGLEPHFMLYRIDDLNLTGSEGHYDVWIKGVGEATTLDSTKVTYLDWDCHGFRKVHLAGEIDFSRDDFLPINDQQEVIAGDERLKATFRMSYTRGTNIIAALDFNHPFEHTDLPDWQFTVNNAFVDYSELENPPDIEFPEGYEDESVFNADFTNLWEGVFIKNIVVRVPERYKSFNQTGNLTLLANNLIIDGETGFSGFIQANNVIEYPNGNLDGWQYSLDTIRLKWVSNDFRMGRLDGKIRIAGLEEDEFLSYFALLNRDEVNVEDDEETEEVEEGTSTATTLEFVCEPNTDIDYTFESLHSTLKFTQDSRLSIDYQTGAGWDVLATLNGSLTLEDDWANQIQQIPGVNFRGIEFQGFQIGNKVGFETGNWSLASPPKTVGGYPVNLRDVTLERELSTDGVRLGLAFNFDLNISEVLSAEASLAVWAKLHMPQDGAHYVEADGVAMSDYELTKDFGIVELSGDIGYFEDDPVYGNGFGGDIQAKFNIGDGYEAQVLFMSGRTVRVTPDTGHYRYWLLDAYTNIPRTPLFAGLYLSGVGGGIYHNMQMQVEEDENDFFQSFTFLPNEDVDLGLALAARVETEEESTFNADARLTAEFADYSINLIDFRGRGYFMTKVSKRENPQFLAELSLQIDFTEGILAGNVDAYINVEDDWLKGNSSNSPDNNTPGYAGSASMYFDTDGVWRILIGQPNSPISVSFKNMASAQAYFMLGNAIPQVEFGDGFSVGVSTNMVSGIAFGADLSFDTGKKTFLIFYGQFQAHLGFDVAIQQSSDVVCPEASGGVRGINGWYAQGMLRAGFYGAVGITVDLLLVSGDFEIFSIGADIDLLAKLPNPSYFVGRLSGHYSILAGAISGHCNFKVELGSDCTDPNAPPVAFTAIGQVVPAENEAIEVYAFPQASFNLKMNTPITLLDDNGDEHIYRAQVQAFQIKDGNTIVANNFVLNDNLSLATLKQQRWLEGNSTYQIYLAVKWQERINNNWEDVYLNGSLYLETRSHSFQTKDRPDHIPEEMVVVTYPLNRQRFYLQGEHNQGLVRMNQLPVLDDNLISGTYAVRLIRLHPNDTLPEVPFNLSQQVQFALPPLEHQRIYRVELVRRESSPVNLNAILSTFGQQAQVATLATMDSVVTQVFDQEIQDDGSWLAQRTNTIEGQTLGLTPEKVIYSYHFKTSSYNTLEEKLTAMTSLGTRYVNNGDKELMALDYQLAEAFDEYDLVGWPFDENNTGSPSREPLIDFFTNWSTSTSAGSWMGDYNRHILECAEAILVPPINPNLSFGVLVPEAFFPTVAANPNYTYSELLTDQEIESNTPVTWVTNNQYSGSTFGNTYGFHALPARRYWPQARVLTGMSSTAQFTTVLSGSGYSMGGGSSMGSYVSGYEPPPPQPPPMEYLHLIDEPALPSSTYFYLRYETSLAAYEVYRDTWHKVRGRNNTDTQDQLCDYFAYRPSTLNEMWYAPGYHRMAHYSETYRVSSHYRLGTFVPGRSDHSLIDSLNFTID